MSTYTAPIPPVTATPVGRHDRFGVPQDVVRTATAAPPTVLLTPRRRTCCAGRRSVLVSVALAAVLGPVGLLYSSRSGAVLTSVLFVVITLPLAVLWWKWIFVAAALTAPVCMAWALVATLGHNAAHALRRRRRVVRW